MWLLSKRLSMATGVIMAVPVVIPVLVVTSLFATVWCVCWTAATEIQDLV